jgi:hypothetical protein
MLDRYIYRGMQYVATFDLVEDLKALGINFHQEVQDLIDATKETRDAQVDH